MKKQALYLILSFSLFYSCKKDQDPLSLNEAYSGGETTVFVSGPTAYTFALSNLDATGLTKHLEADAIFSQHFVTAPATNFGGLGPLFNQNSCESCHLRNGRGNPMLYDGDIQTGGLLKIGLDAQDVHGMPLPVPNYGGQIQTKAIFGQDPEAVISFTEWSQLLTYSDGSQVQLNKKLYQLSTTYTSAPSNYNSSFRMAPPVFGLGLLEAIAEADILQNEDPNDNNGDGISGKANWVYNPKTNLVELGRYGWKASNATAEQQSAAAANEDMGLSNSYFPNENCSAQSNCQTGLQSNLDLSTENLELMAFYFQTLAVPASRNVESEAFKAGKIIFFEAKCNACHSPTFTTSYHPISSLSYQNIHPYSDFLLHDMGLDLADNRREALAEGSEWRTPPLWGLGLSKVVNPKVQFLHDGRAATIEEAILWHGGEAENSRNFVLQLSLEQRNKLLYFLNSL
ncbi:MAG: di-heme oxidoredictase family protein [Chitinophagales bacterium]